MTCDVVCKQLPLVLYGELTFDEEEAVHQHLDGCGPCQAEMAAVRQLHKSADALEPELPAQLLQDARRTLRVSVSALRETGYQQSRSGWWWKLVPDLGSAWKAAGAVALLTAGFFAGRVAPEPGGGGRFTMASLSPGDPVASRVRFVQPDKAGRVQIVVEEVRQRVLEGGVNDDKIRGLLLLASREANDPGVRVETMDLLKNQSASVEVRRALLAALQQDENPGVRLKALEALRGAPPSDADTRRVLIQVLLTDANPGVRNQAIDLLTQHREPAMVGVLQELVSRQGDDYVRQKCQKALREMNASVETF